MAGHRIENMVGLPFGGGGGEVYGPSSLLISLPTLTCLIHNDPYGILEPNLVCDFGYSGNHIH